MTVRGLLLWGALTLLLSGCERKQQNQSILSQTVQSRASQSQSSRSQISQSQRTSDAELQGEWLYDENCAECHENSQPELHKQPPNLHGIFRCGTLASGAPANDAEVRKTIIEGRGTMPAFDGRLREVDVENLISYLCKLN